MGSVPSQRFMKDFSPSPLDLYRALRTVNPSPYMFILEAGDFSIVGGASVTGGPRGDARAVSSSIVSFPAPAAPKKPAGEENPDTAVGPEPKEIPLSEEKRNVRVVGPTFLPDPRAAIDLRAPARTKVP